MMEFFFVPGERVLYEGEIFTVGWEGETGLYSLLRDRDGAHYPDVIASRIRRAPPPPIIE